MLPYKFPACNIEEFFQHLFHPISPFTILSFFLYIFLYIFVQMYKKIKYFA